MKKKYLNYILYVFTFFIVVYYALNLSGILVLYNNPTISNSPNLPEGSRSIGTNTITPKNGDFVCYNFNDEYSGKHIRVHRLVGLEGDTIQIKKGVVFLNGKNFDKDLNLTHFYKTAKENLIQLKKSEVDLSSIIIEQIDNDTIKLLLEDSFIKELSFEIHRFISDEDFINQETKAIYNKPWNEDNFGPIIIPENKIFVLGDNRSYTIDSRTIGLINADEIVSVLIKTF
ncbi:signal peptidase I [Polaribacter vadi]|uniref:signal peptidase I n=1 Tax=Polaribacter vadi TaxID=1774273 RepID=UPI0030ECA72F|tara:strand:+ start:2450 stop:3136 length:687 start_codon:yes stop_codon:yes gene_type:complete